MVLYLTVQDTDACHWAGTLKSKLLAQLMCIVYFENMNVLSFFTETLQTFHRIVSNTVCDHVKTCEGAFPHVVPC